MGLIYAEGVSAHAQHRMAERVGRYLTAPEWLAIRNAILTRAAVLTRQDGEASIWAVPLGGMTLKVVWRAADAMVVTSLSDAGQSDPVVKAVKRGKIKASLIKQSWANAAGHSRRKPKTMWNREAKP